MRIPTSASLSNVVSNIITDADTPAFDTPETIPTRWRSRKYGRPFASHHRYQKSRTPAPSEGNEEDHDIEGRASACPRGKEFYRCANGFRGCCSHDPCDPGGSYRDGEKASHQKESSKNPTHTQESTPHVTAHHSSVTQSHPHGHHTPTVSHQTPQHTSTSGISQSSDKLGTSSTTSIMSVSPTNSSPSTTFSGPLMSDTAPACPGGNGTHYTDSAKVEYVIHCGMENTYASNNAIWVATGGYAQCFLACSNTDACGGFTFVGTESGNCYMKSQMPDNAYVTHDGHNYITAAKADPPNNSGGGSAMTPKKAGIIAGAVIGSLLLIGLILFCIACCAKRHRKKVEEKRATVTHVIQGPTEMQPYRPPTDYPDHQRQGSTSHDFNGGYSPRKFDTTAKGNSQVGNLSGTALFGLEQTLREDKNGDIRPESGFVPIMMPASMYSSQNSPKESSRSPRFHEQLNEQYKRQPEPKSLRGVSTMDSPTLGTQPGYSISFADDVRRKQHLTRAVPPRNTPSPKNRSPVSPNVDNQPPDRGFKVSPVESGGIRWREV